MVLLGDGGGPDHAQLVEEWREDTTNSFTGTCATTLAVGFECLYRAPMQSSSGSTTWRSRQQLIVCTAPKYPGVPAGTAALQLSWPRQAICEASATRRSHELGPSAVTARQMPVIRRRARSRRPPHWRRCSSRRARLFRWLRQRQRASPRSSYRLLAGASTSSRRLDP